jgi:hypothetical protein
MAVLDILAVALAPTLINLWLVMAVSKVSAAFYLCMLPLWLIIAKNLVLLPGLGSARDTRLSAVAWITLIFVLWLGVQVVRSASIGGSFQLCVFLATTVLFGYAVYSRFGSVAPELITRALFHGLGLFLVLNLGLHLAGVRPPSIGQVTSAGDALMLSLIGIDTPRVVFPLATSLNGYAVTSGLGLVVAFGMLAKRASKGLDFWWWLTVLIAAGISILLGDSRGAALFALAVIFFMSLAPRFAKERAHWIIVLAPLGSVAAAALLVAFAESGGAALLPEAVQLFLRPDAGGDDLGSGRALVWSVAAEELLEPKAAHMVGYGFYGHVISGISKYYAALFPYLDNPDFATLHNAALQYVIDAGYIGLLLFFGLLFMTVKRAALARVPLSAPVVAAGLFFVLMGLTEAVPTPYMRDAFLVFVMLCFHAATIPNSPRSICSATKRTPPRHMQQEALPG